MLYRFLKFIIGYAVRQYFREVQLRNEDLVPQKGPIIVLPNHRSGFMDPIVVAIFLKRNVHFLARGESFKNPLMAKLLGKLSVIPIYRKEYSPEEVHKNDEIFRYCFTKLEQNEALVIFPEGASQTKPVLLPLKTGAARIALGAEAKNNFNLGVTLIPVGINYTNPHHFQGKLFLNFGNPIFASDYKDEYSIDPFKAVNNLTKQVEDELKKRIVVVDESRWYDLTNKVEKIIQTDYARFGIRKNEVHIGWFMARKDIAAAIEYFSNEKKEILESLELKVQQYFSIIDLLNLKEGTINPIGDKGRLKFFTLLFYFILGLPFFIIGLVLHFLPYYFTNLLVKLVVKRSDFYGSIILVIGLLLFTLNAGLMTSLVFKASQNEIVAIVFFLLLAPIGIFTFQYYVGLKRWWYQMKIWIIGNRKTTLIKELSQQRETLLASFKEAHEDYLNYEKQKI